MKTDVQPLPAAVRVRKSASTLTRYWGERGLLHLLALMLTFVFVLPAFWTLSSSLKHPSNIFVFPPTWWPTQPQWQNYVLIWQLSSFGVWTRNSVIVGLFGVLGQSLSACAVAYGFARFRFPGRDLLFLACLSTLILPSEVTIIPQFLLFNELKWLDTLLPLIVPYFLGGSAFFIFLMRQFFLTIPHELDDAAKIDGAGSVRIFFNLLLPLSKPAVVTVAIFSFIHHWSDFFSPLIFLNSKENFTLALGLRYFQQAPVTRGQPKEHLLMAASVTVTIPLIVLFFVTQRYFVRGIVMSGIKG
jgi:ABC-type glycerol-3-phosphate transport system permease component